MKTCSKRAHWQGCITCCGHVFLNRPPLGRVLGRSRSSQAALRNLHTNQLIRLLFNLKQGARRASELADKTNSRLAHLLRRSNVKFTLLRT